MNDLTGEYLGLLETAKIEARRLAGQRVGIHDTEDIASEMLVSLFEISMKKHVENPRALLRTLAFQVFTRVVRREQRRRCQPFIDKETTNEHAWIEEHDNIKDVTRLLQNVTSDVQRSIIWHVWIGYDVMDREERELIAKCAKVPVTRIAVELCRLKELVERCRDIPVTGEWLEVPLCECWPLLQEQLRIEGKPTHRMPPPPAPIREHE